MLSPLIGSGRSISDAPNRGVRALPYVERSHQPGNSVKPEATRPAAGGPSGGQYSGKGKTDVGGKSGGSYHVKSRDHSRKH